MNESGVPDAATARVAVESRSADFAITVGLLFLTVNLALVVVPMLGLMLFAPVQGWMAPAGWVSGLVAVAGMRRRFGSRHLVAAGLIVVASFVIALLVAQGFFDRSYDGRTYHQETVLALSQGWNPFDGSQERAAYGIWVQHYPKAFELAATPHFQLFGALEAAKAIHVLPLGAALAFSLGLLLRLGLTPSAAGPIAALAALNPVWVVQSLTFYVDGAFAALLLVGVAAVFATVLLGRSPDWSAALGMSLVLLIGLKFTGMFFVGLLGLGLLAALMVKGRRGDAWQMGWQQGLAVIAALVVVGAHPYVHNLMDSGNPFYPLMGADSIDIITTNTPLNLREASQPIQLLFGVFGEPGNPIETEADLAVPFIPIAGSGDAYRSADTRIAGLGPLFGGTLLVSAGLLGWIVLRRLGGWQGAAMTWAAVLASVAVHPEGWWARYAPQLWVVPLVVVVAAVRSRKAAVAGWLVASLLFVDVSFVGGHNLRASLEHSREVQAVLGTLQGTVTAVALAPQFRIATRALLGSAGVTIVEHESAATLPCGSPQALPAQAGWYCPPA